jgi:hypothetical protein
MRFRFSFGVAILLALHLMTGTLVAAEGVLPTGEAKPPVTAAWFPSPLHAVVWRNWDLVPTERIAKALEATPAEIEAIATSMGLPPNRPVAAKYHAHNYKTILRHNWHLLPYEQLLILVDMTAEELAFMLHEDDFLFIKLGNFKPACDPVKYREPTAEEQARAAEIATLIKQRFGDSLSDPGEPRYQFIEDYSQPIDPPAQPREPRSTKPRFLYSYFTVFGDPLLDPAIDPYPDRLLAEYADCGVNGIWMHVVLRQLAPGGPHFPEWGDRHEERLANLRKLVDRAAQHGIRLYLYINEPRAMPREFFSNHPDLAGGSAVGLTSICTSDARTREWLHDSLKHVFTEVPGLGGVFTITASENVTSCASHGQHHQCPRCKERTPAEIIAEVNATIEAGVHAAAPDAQVICWDWGWNGHGDSADHIALLPKNVALQSVSEWALPIERGGVKNTIGEYSMSAVGPGPRATRHWQLAKERGLEAFAKVQVNNTWELSSVPFLPVADLVAEHADKLAEQEVDGLMLSWSLGGSPSPNLKIATRLIDDPNATPGEVLTDVATRRYGAAAASKVREAWSAFSRAFREFPYNGSVVYLAPQQFGPANPLYPEPTGYASTMIGFPYDDLDGWRGNYPREAFAVGFTWLAAEWQRGVALLDEAITLVDGAHRDVLQRDRGTAAAAGIHFRSVAWQSLFVMARDTLRSDPQRDKWQRQCDEAVRKEIEAATELYSLMKSDSRIGFEASNGYYYTPLDLVEKVINCQWVPDQMP